jgi:DNA-binding IclR family transcriptional regulator
MCAMPADRSASPGRPVGSVERALALLDVLAASEEGLGVNELARRTGVSPSSASRLLATLERGRLVEREPGGPYRLGLQLVALADRVLARLDVRALARPWLQRLAAETGETATLSVPGGGEAITVDFVASESSVVSMARLGRPSVSHATAAGKVLLAFGGASPPGGGDDGRQLAAFTERTIVDRRLLAEEVASVRARGFAEAVGEREPDLNALAAPVIGRGGELVAILGLQGPAARLPASTRRALRGPLRKAAAELGRSLGGPG